jgi:hypothetical protein
MQPARFHALRDRTLAAVDRTFAEPVRLVFMANGSPDQDRQARNIEAVLRAATSKETMVSGGRDRDWNSRITAQRAELHIDRIANPDLAFRNGDRVKALSRLGGPWFEVLAVDDRGSDRLILQLGEV